MPRSFRNISMYEKEIMELISQGRSLREFGEKIGFSYEQMHNFKMRYNAKQRKLAVLRYKLDRKEARINQLEIENELMRDFLALTERK